MKSVITAIIVAAIIAGSAGAASLLVTMANGGASAESFHVSVRCAKVS